jgi:pimeloyl-ACP methyl ester carboxylesterase
MADLTHRYVETNRIKMHFVEQGEGPLVILCHGFPESWYSYRHQIPALAAAGFHVVAPDQRGYGQTDKPEDINAYNLFQVTGDIVGLVNALGEEQAVIVGHDWGAPVAWMSCLLRPDVFRAIGLLSVPYLANFGAGERPSVATRAAMGDELEFYQLYFQEPGKAEAELEHDVRKSVRMFLYSASGDPPPEQRWRFIFPRNESFLQQCVDPDVLPSWLTEADVDFFSGEFEKSGFRGGLNWYRNIDFTWEVSGFLNGAKLRQPALFVSGEHDAVLAMYPDALRDLEKNVPNLRKKVVLPGVGHWTQQERPDEVNALLIEFLKSL